MRYLVVALVLGVMVPSLGLSQSYFSHHLSAPYLYNASYLAKLSSPEVALLTRARWLGYASTYDSRGNLPNAQHLALLYPLTKIPMGVGLGITRTSAGPVQVFQLQAMVNYTVRLSRRSRLGFSLTPAWLAHQRDASLYRATDPADPALAADQSIQNFTLQAGTAYFYQALTVGVSVNDLFALSVPNNLAGGAQITVPLSVNLMTSYDWALSAGRNTRRRGIGLGRSRRGGPETIATTALVTKQIIITPSLFAIYKPGGFTFNVGTQVAYDRVWGGVLYRYQEAVTFFGGVRLLRNRNLRLGYGLETVVHHARSKAATSHEIYLAFGLKGLRTSKPPIHTPRFYY